MIKLIVILNNNKNIFKSHHLYKINYLKIHIISQFYGIKRFNKLIILMLIFKQYLFLSKLY